MARTKRSKTENRERRAQRAKWRATILHYMTGPGSETIWPVVQAVIQDLFTTRADILREYVRTAGSTDWVWLEEHMSRAISDSPNLDELDEHSDDSEFSCAYTACMLLALGVIRTIHPLVQYPLWMADDLVTIWGKTPAPSDIAAVARDLFLQGRDQEALALRGELAGEGPFLLFRSGFFQDADAYPRRRHGIAAKLSSAASFSISPVEVGEFDGAIEDGLGVDEAIGAAIRAHAERPDLLFVVRCHDTNVAAWNDHVIFAISGDASKIADLEREIYRDQI